MEHMAQKMKKKEENTKVRVNELAEIIERYQASYYSGDSEITDAEFDLLWDELKRLDSDHPVLKKIGRGSVDGFPKAKHLIHMGSQEKAANPDEFLAWAKKTGIASFVVQHKLDGASLGLQYEKGKLKKAVTRGDGIIGDEITANALRMSGVVPKLPTDFSGGVRGEVIMMHRVWKTKYSDKANCRNAANGIMRRKDGSGCEDLTFVSYDAAASGDDAFFKTEPEKIAWLKKQGFTAAETKQFDDPKSVIKYRAEIAENRKNMGFDIDGLVVKDFYTDSDDLRKARPERQIAFKFDLETAYSVLREVIWSESGTTYTPIGVVDPVRIAGTTVQRANLNNPDMIRAMGLKIGSAVVVVKRGEIIPKIEGLAPAGALTETAGKPAKESEIVFPDTCAACNSTLVDAGTRLFCPNAACPKKLHHRLEKWVAVLDIREIGQKLLRQLFDSLKVRTIPNLYTLTEKELAEFDRMGEISAAKVIRHIQTKRELTLAEFVAGFNLDGVGELVMEKVVTAGFDSLEKLRSASSKDLAEIHGIGEITAAVIADGIAECSQEMDEVLRCGVISIAPPPSDEAVPLKGISFCFTGELKTMKRSQAEEKAKALGGSIKSGVVKDLSYLVTNDVSAASSKSKKALSLGIQVIDEEKFLALLAGRDFSPEKSQPEQPNLF